MIALRGIEGTHFRLAEALVPAVSAPVVSPVP